MSNTSLSWLLLAMVLSFYALYVFISGASDSLWSLITGVICAIAACTAYWRSKLERSADRG
ncbi:hypothetical protein ACFUOZ_15150 [Paenarthrobacter sp. NPDC057355]|uniref:hypothetical protein n=1 Tax=Paenarthrobacter sp. NPDC057355 TaxID=3346105 RepID=UPI003639A1E8